MLSGYEGKNWTLLWNYKLNGKNLITYSIRYCAWQKCMHGTLLAPMVHLTLVMVSGVIFDPAALKRVIFL